MLGFTTSSSSSHGTFRVSTSKTSQVRFLGPSSPAIAAGLTVQSLLASCRTLEYSDISVSSGVPNPMIELSRLDRSILTSDATESLLSHYNRSIHPLFPILDSPLKVGLQSSISRLPHLERFHILMACGIAATHKSFHDPDWRVLAQVCRNWAAEHVKSIVAERDGKAFVALLLLLVYELACPDRGVFPELLDFAIRICLQMGWHKFDEGPDRDMALLGKDGKEKLGQPEFSDKRILQLMSVLHSIERYYTQT